MKQPLLKGAALIAGATLFAQPALAAPAADAVSPGTAYILNTLLFLIGGFLVMWMAAGFAMLEAGLVRAKNTSTQCLKNIGLYSIAGLMFWIIGYNIAYPGEFNGFIGGFSGWYPMQGVGVADTDTGYSVASDWFFQMVFCATT
ncbi:MAG: ammonium transporter, partial [Pseudomonadota bacterium]